MTKRSATKRSGLLKMALAGAALSTTLGGGARVGLADEVANLAKELAGLRNEVETLSHDVGTKRGDLDNQLKSYARQKAELEAELGREQVRLQKIRQVVSDRRSLIDKQQAEEAKLRPALETSVAQARAYVEQSLPFRRTERLAELGKLEDQYKAGLLTTERALARLWAYMEDEFRLSNENGVYRQAIAVDGKEQLADIARLGMVAFYYRTADGGYGRTTRKPDGAWTLVAIDGKEDRKQIDQVFESFRKQLRVGLFELPQALPQKTN